MSHFNYPQIIFHSGLDGRSDEEEKAFYLMDRAVLDAILKVLSIYIYFVPCTNLMTSCVFMDTLCLNR